MVKLLGTNTFFQDQTLILIGNAPFFHFALLSLSNIVYCGVQKEKGKLFFRKIDIE